MSNFIMLLLEKVFEAIYFSLFMIYGKNIKEKRLLFIIIMIVEYLLFKAVIHYNVWFQIIYIFMSFVNLKVLYKEKAQITDIFLFMASSIILMIICGISYALIYFTIKKYIYALILSRIFMILFIVIFKDKINNLYMKFYSLWNRKKEKTKIKSLTLRNISVILFNIMFYIINIGMTICLYLGRR